MIQMSACSSKGIIPACAGSSSWLLAHQMISRDHPRVCGEQVAMFSGFGAFEGSSPRVRGAVKCTNDNLDTSRIIPACAGSRSTE